MKRVMMGLFAGAALLAAAASQTPQAQVRSIDRTEELRRALEGGTARNVILFIGDGMGDSEITAARNYQMGAAGRLAMDSLPFTGAYTTWSVDETNPSMPTYVPDSAATATAWATGSKTSNGRISTTASTDRDLPTILEAAKARGYRTGNVSTAELTDATPAALAAHVANRSCHGPADMAACLQDRASVGGPGSIAEQLVAHDIDVMLGGGAARFEQPTEAGPSSLALAERRGYQVVRTRTAMTSLRPGTGKVLGVFTPGNMTTEWAGDLAAVYPSNIGRPQTCRPQTRSADEPTLAEMTSTALRLLDRTALNGPGFFLQVEGASIDKQDHQADPCGQIGETVGFDRAIRLGLDYAAAHPGTLVVVTADHGHTSQIVGTPSETSHPAGLFSSLRTLEGGTLTLSYGTNVPGSSQDHTGTEVRIAAQGPQAANVLGVTDQTDLFRLLSRAIGTRDVAPVSSSSGAGR